MKITDEYVFFWREYLSQWNMKSFKDNEGIEYSCAEQYMMAKKAQLFNDDEIYDLIMEDGHPKQMQTHGRQVHNFDKRVWDQNAIAIVYQGNLYKFQQNPELLEGLVATRGRTLVEASPFDEIWGIGLAEDSPWCTDRDKWRGTNWLGYTLTNLRDNYFKV